MFKFKIFDHAKKKGIKSCLFRHFSKGNTNIRPNGHANEHEVPRQNTREIRTIHASMHIHRKFAGYLLFRLQLRLANRQENSSLQTNSLATMTIKINLDSNIKDIVSEFLQRNQIAHCFDCFDPTNERMALICYCSTLKDIIYVSYLGLLYGGLKINDLM